MPALVFIYFLLIFLYFAGRSFIQNTTQHALETMPRSADGLIDVDKLTPEQHRVYNA